MPDAREAGGYGENDVTFSRVRGGLLGKNLGRGGDLHVGSVTPADVSICDYTTTQSHPFDYDHGLEFPAAMTSEALYH